jgi:hypothetical protein
MSLDPVTALVEAGMMAISRIWPDPVQQAAEVRKLEELRQKGDLAELNAHVSLMLAQIKVNQEEAKSASVFVSGWRPFIGWAGGFSLIYAGLVYPLLTWLWSLLQAFDLIPKEISPPPFVESSTLGAIVTGMLGIGTMRSYDKTKGTSKDSI